MWMICDPVLMARRLWNRSKVSYPHALHYVKASKALSSDPRGPRTWEGRPRMSAKDLWSGAVKEQSSDLNDWLTSVKEERFRLKKTNFHT